MPPRARAKAGKGKGRGAKAKTPAALEDKVCVFLLNQNGFYWEVVCMFCVSSSVKKINGWGMGCGWSLVLSAETLQNISLGQRR